MPSTQAYAQRSDHLAIVAAFNGWAAARASGGRSAGSDFARASWLSEQVWLEQFFVAQHTLFLRLHDTA